MKTTLLIPIYNDRESLKKLIENINNEVKDLNSEISIVVINDASSQQIIDNYQNLENIHSFEIINMRENRGHARCIASCLKYILPSKSVPIGNLGSSILSLISGIVSVIK